MKALAPVSVLVLAATLGVASVSADVLATAASGTMAAALAPIASTAAVITPASSVTPAKHATAAHVASSTRATTAPAVETAAHVRRAHHRRLHHAAPPNLRTTRVAAPHASLPAPAAPRPRRSHRHATVPHVTHSLRPHRGAKTNAQAMAAANGGVLLEMDVRALDPHQNLEPDESVDVVKSGRGPPRAGPSMPFSARHPGEPAGGAHPAAFASLDPSVSLDLPPSTDPATPSRTARMAVPCPDRSYVPVFLPPEAASTSLHAGRTEGQAACFHGPSIGGI